MAITRGLMQRELYGIGSYFPEVNGRSKFGLGSKLKRTFRKIIPNEVSSIAVKAAPFVAPFNPLLAGAMAGIGGFDQTGRIGSSLKSGLLTYGGGQLARYLGGAGFQQGINPFAGYNPSASFGGLGSLFSSPIGTQTGLQLGQYKLFGGPGSEAFKAGQNIANLGQQSLTPYSPGTFIGEGMEAGTVVPDISPTTFIGEGMEAGYVVPDVTSQATTQAVTSAVTPGVTKTPGYMDLFKQVLGGDLQQKTEAIKQLGGKALKDIYTKQIINPKTGETITQLDKLALGATIAGGMSYMEAKKLAKEAELVAQEEEYTKQQYEADRKRYADYYSKILKPEYFGITAKATGGRVGYAEKGIVSLTDEDSGVMYYDENKKPISKEQAMKLFNKQADEEGIKGIVPPKRPMNMKKKRIMEILKKGGAALEKESLDRLLQKYSLTENKANGGRVGYKDGTKKKTKREQRLNRDLIPFIDKIMTDEEGSMRYPLQRMRKIGEDLFFFGEPNPELSYMEFDKMPMDYQNKVEDAREEKRRWYQKYDYPEAPRYERMADGGITDIRNQYAMGSEVPVRQNQAGVQEMDYRNTGGFVPPIGVKEKADDIPAMLSNNEFVFTADAVRAAGGGSVNKGAQRMYALMKQLEGKVV